MLGIGGIRKVVMPSASASIEAPSLLGRSCMARPPIRISASLWPGISSNQGRNTVAVPPPTVFAVIRRSSTKSRASLLPRVSRQQLVEIQHLDAALLHLQHEVVVVLLRLVHPDDVVEEQIVAVSWRQPLMRAPGRADHDRPQLAHFRMHAEFPCHAVLRHSVGSICPAAQRGVLVLGSERADPAGPHEPAG